MSLYDVVIRDGTVVSPFGSRRADVGVRNGRVAAVSADGLIKPGQFSMDGPVAADVIDARGKLVFPGLIDVHTHFGLTSGDMATSDDFYSGTVAAACGGVTTVIDFATPVPGGAVAEALADRIREASRAVVDYGFHGVLIEPVSVGEVPGLVRLGVTSFKLYLAYKARGLMADDATLAGALEAVRGSGGLVGVHAEDEAMVAAAAVELTKAGNTAMPFFAAARPAEAERAAIARACRLAERAGAALYIFHLSTAAGLEEIRQARLRGLQVWAETCPTYLTFTDEVYARPDGYKFAMNPPLRKPADVDALWAGLAEGQIQTVASDHCPFPLAAKARGAASFADVPAGVGGTELILTVLLSEGVAKGRLSPERLVQVTAANPAALFGLYAEKGRLGPGADADLVIVDPDAEWTVAPAELHSQGDYTPYEGLKARGRVVVTMARGRVVYRDGSFVGEAGAGHYVSRAKPHEVHQVQSAG
ncbi:MAG: dihydropyrimidinase [Bacillota bacterium]